jgi:hypothetical protein
VSSRGHASNPFPLDGLASAHLDRVTNKISASELLYGHSMYMRPLTGPHRPVSLPGSFPFASGSRRQTKLVASGLGRPLSAERYSSNAAVGPTGRLEKDREIAAIRGTQIGSPAPKLRGRTATTRPGTPSNSRQQRSIAAQWSAAAAEASAQKLTADAQQERPMLGAAPTEGSASGSQQRPARGAAASEGSPAKGPRRGSSPYPKGAKSRPVSGGEGSGVPQTVGGALMAGRLLGRSAELLSGGDAEATPPLAEQHASSRAGASKGSSRSSDGLRTSKKASAGSNRASPLPMRRDGTRDRDLKPKKVTAENKTMEAGLSLGLRRALAAVRQETSFKIKEEECAMCGALDWEACEGMQALRRLGSKESSQGNLKEFQTLQRNLARESSQSSEVRSASNSRSSASGIKLPNRASPKPVRAWPALPEPWAPYCAGWSGGNACSDLMRECHALTGLVGLNDAWLEELSSCSSDVMDGDSWSEC